MTRCPDTVRFEAELARLRAALADASAAASALDSMLAPAVPPPDPIEAELAWLVSECGVQGIKIELDGTIAEKAATAFVPRSARTIEGWRYRDNPISAKVGTRWRVCLRKLAAFRCGQ